MVRFVFVKRKCMYLLNFRKDGKLYDEDAWSVPEFRAILELEDIGETLFHSIALTMDYKSVFRYYNEDERFSAVLKVKFGKTRPAGVPIHSKKVKDAMSAYTVLQYDDLEEDLRIVRKKMKEINDLLDSSPITTDNFEVMSKMLMGKDKYIEQRNKIMKLIEKRGELVDLKLGNDIVLSRLEKKLVQSSSM